jgi:hypothetical protein
MQTLPMASGTQASFTLALPVDRYNSLKPYVSTGITTRTGSEFKIVGIAWQYRRDAGYQICQHL